MNLVEWLVYAAACERWHWIGGLLWSEDYDDVHAIVLEGERLRGRSGLK